MELVEREEFLNEMTTAFTEVTAGRGQFVLVSGEAGIGKTSLVETFTAAHEAPRAAILAAVLEEMDGRTPSIFVETTITNPDGDG